LHVQVWLKVCSLAAAASLTLGFGASAAVAPLSPAVRTETAEASLAGSLSRLQLAGQRVIYSYAGRVVPARLLSLIRHGEAAGVIFFAANYQSRSQFTAVVRSLETANASKSNPARAYPLLLMADQEGGEVRRLPGAPVHSEAWIGARSTASDRAYQAQMAGKAAGRNLLSYGLNVNLAPVLDVYRSPGDFDDEYQRSYSSSAAVVSALGSDFITAQQAVGVAAAAKHFPGLGAATASQNTDERPVTIRLSRTALHNVDEYPYRAAIKAGVKLVMVSWAKYPSLGADVPAGLSPAIVQGQLRKLLGFTGVTVTDSIGAGALAPYGSTGNRALRAAEAGMELILAASQSTGEGVDCMDALRSALGDGRLAATGFRASVAQILQLRASLPA